MLYQELCNRIKTLQLKAPEDQRKKLSVKLLTIYHMFFNFSFWKL